MQKDSPNATRAPTSYADGVTDAFDKCQHQITITDHLKTSPICYLQKQSKFSDINQGEQQLIMCPCCNCNTPRKSASILTCLGVCILILVYTFAGAFVFLAIESGLHFQKEETSVAASKPNLSASERTPAQDLRIKTVEKLWSITEDLNILYKENWTRLAAKELTEFQRMLVRSMRSSQYDQRGSSYMSKRHKWTFSTSFLYSLTIITTIGYGNVTPRTSTGKLVTIAYAFIGIPLVLVYLSAVGDALASNFRSLFGKTCRYSSRDKDELTLKSNPNVYFKKCFVGRGIQDKNVNKQFYDDICSDQARQGSVVFAEEFDKNTVSSSRTPFQAALNLECYTRHYHRCHDQARVPILLCIFILIMYLAAGTFIFNKTENWSFIEGCYFSFTSLGTIGFGDLYPGEYGSNISVQAGDISICICCVYILVGMAVVAMCFNLMQDEIIIFSKKLNRTFNGKSKDDVIKDKCGGEEISMALVS